MQKSIIIGSGRCIPNRVIDGEYFRGSTFYDDNGSLIEKDFDELVEKFVEITEIKERRYADDNQSTTDLAKIAAEKAIADAKINPEDLDYIIFAHNFGDLDANLNVKIMPSLSAKLKHLLGIKNVKCVTYDMIFGCPGWVEGMILANDLIRAQRAKTVLVVGAETLSRITDPYDRNKLIFADGAAATIVKAVDEDFKGGFLHSETRCDNADELLYLEHACSNNPNHDPNDLFIKMKGRKIYEYALTNVPAAMKECIDKAGYHINDVKKLLIHQANAKMDHAMVSRLYKLYGLKTYDPNVAPMTIQRFGNSSVATVPTMYDLILRGEFEGQSVESGDLMVFASVGAGMNINAILYQIP